MQFPPLPDGKRIHRGRGADARYVFEYIAHQTCEQGGRRTGEKYQFYDISGIETEEYLWSKRSNPDIKMHWGGVRKRVFGTMNGLTKSPLTLMDGKVRPFITWHHVKGARMADISCLIRHYSFVSSFYAKVEDAVQTGRYGMLVTDEYKTYAKTLPGNAEFNFNGPSMQLFVSLEPLIEAGFLRVSEKYMQWVSEHSSRPSRFKQSGPRRVGNR